MLLSESRATVLLKELDRIAAAPDRSGVEVVPLDESRLPGLAALNRARGRSGVDRRFRRNLERGMHGYVGLRDGRAVGYYWWVDSEGASGHPDLAWLGNCMQIGPGDVYGSDFYVLPGERKDGTANAMLFHIESDLRGRGYERLWGYVDAGNRAARWLYSSRGYEPMGEVSSQRVLFRRLPARPRG